ncbi:hypothetical protein [Lentzea sp. E54]|uniref:hypothetical protein n=1 Tax=Lentzea xerophila TaxID=3435883 RepID=UPI003DA5FF89
MHEQPSGFTSGLRILIVFVAAEVAFLALTLVLYRAADPASAERGQLPDSGLLVLLLIVPPLVAALVAIAVTALSGAESWSTRLRQELALGSGGRRCGDRARRPADHHSRCHGVDALGR